MQEKERKLEWNLNAKWVKKFIRMLVNCDGGGGIKIKNRIAVSIGHEDSLYTKRNPFAYLSLSRFVFLPFKLSTLSTSNPPTVCWWWWWAKGLWLCRWFELMVCREMQYVYVKSKPPPPPTRITSIIIMPFTRSHPQSKWRNIHGDTQWMSVNAIFCAGNPHNEWMTGRRRK